MRCRFVETCYVPKAKSLEDARWLLFSKRLTRGPRLPPTLGAFQGHLKRALVHGFMASFTSASDAKLDLKVGNHGWKWLYIL